MSTSLTYLRYELLRTVRNTRFFIFSLVFPLILFYVVAGANKTADARQHPVPDLLHGRDDQLGHDGRRPGRRRSYCRGTKCRLEPAASADPIDAAHLLPRQGLPDTPSPRSASRCCASLALTLGVHLAPGRWATMICLILIGLIPFAALGVLLGHLTHRRVGRAGTRWITALFALLGGAWGPIPAKAAPCAILSSRCRPIGWSRPGMSLTPARPGRRRPGSLSPSGPSSSPRWPPVHIGATPNGSDQH